MAKRSRKPDPNSGIINTSVNGSQTVLDIAFPAYERRRLSKGATTTFFESEELAYLTLDVVLLALTTSLELRAAFLGTGGQPDHDTMQKIIADTVAYYGGDDGDTELRLSEEDKRNGLRQASRLLDLVFQAENRKSGGAANAKEFLKLTIAAIAYRHWYRPRVEAGPPENGKRKRRSLKTVHFSAILDALRSSGTEIGNEADLFCASDERNSIDVRLDMLRAGLSAIEWAVYETYAIDDDATLELLANHEWPGGVKLTVKQIRGALERAEKKLEHSLATAYAQTQSNN